MLHVLVPNAVHPAPTPDVFPTNPNNNASADSHSAQSPNVVIPCPFGAVAVHNKLSNGIGLPFSS